MPDPTQVPGLSAADSANFLQSLRSMANTSPTTMGMDPVNPYTQMQGQLAQFANAQQNAVAGMKSNPYYAQGFQADGKTPLVGRTPQSYANEAKFLSLPSTAPAGAPPMPVPGQGGFQLGSPTPWTPQGSSGGAQMGAAGQAPAQYGGDPGSGKPTFVGGAFPGGGGMAGQPAPNAGNPYANTVGFMQAQQGMSPGAQGVANAMAGGGSAGAPPLFLGDPGSGKPTFVGGAFPGGGGMAGQPAPNAGNPFANLQGFGQAQRGIMGGMAGNR